MEAAPPTKRKRAGGDEKAAGDAPPAAAAPCRAACCRSAQAACPPPPPPAPPARTFHRRALPDECIAFSSDAGRQLFARALSGPYMRAYFPLAEQFTTQAEPAFCGLATLAMSLNALQIDPGRLWKGAWRWFSEELLDCCAPLSVAKEKGISLAEFVCLARCNGARATAVHADSALSLDALRALVKRCCASGGGDDDLELLVLNYTRRALAQTGDGHFSPVGGYDEASDMVLLLDVARFKYPPHWVRLPLVLEALQQLDASSGLPRGVVLLRADKEQRGPTAANRLAQARARGEGHAPSCCAAALEAALRDGLALATAPPSSSDVVPPH